MPVVDHIVVGGGTAGCVLASRLSEDPARTVLLLEAGPDYANWEARPPPLRSGDASQWQWDMPARIVGERMGTVARGRVVGGSAAVNMSGMLRASAADFAEWGEPEWSWEAVLPSYRALEADAEFGGQPYHGDAGPVPISRDRRGELSGIMAGFVEAVLTAGHPWCADMNAPDAEGIGPFPKNRAGVERMPTARTHLLPARSRANLSVRGDTAVQRLALAGDRVVGVLVDGETITAHEVVLAAGAPQSPALLLRSGIGPADELRAAGVEARVDLPDVGRELYDQPGAVLPALPLPDTVAATGLRTQVIARLGDDYLNLFAGRDPVEGEPVAAVMVGDFRPASRGSVTLHGPEDVRVDLGYYRTPGDLARMRKRYRHAWEIAQHPAFRRLITGFAMADEATVADDDTLDELLLTSTFSRLTLAGGARMGPVVDAHCRVHGVTGLRVVDLSVVPGPLHASSAFEAMLIGEHAARWVTDAS